MTDDLYFPSRSGSRWEVTTPARADLSQKAIDSACEYAQLANTRQLVVLHAGRIVVERYFACSPHDREDVFAVQKSVFALLLGAAVDRGMIGVDAPLHDYLPPGWTKLDQGNELSLTVRHILTMTTGMDDTLAPCGEIGVTWRYNNAAYGYLKGALCALAGQNLNELTHDWLGWTLGLEQSLWTDRIATLPDGRPITALLMNARDMGRFGLVMLAAGAFDRRRVIEDVSYLRACLQPGSGANPAWGYLWWLNGQSHYMLPYSERVFGGPIVPEMPEDLIAARGAQDQRIIIIPSRSLVIARLGGAAPKAAGRFDYEFLKRLLISP
jgi:CubicO group peptidase (beta-lactamase class C family)